MISKLAADEQMPRTENQKTSLAEVPKAMCTQAKTLKRKDKERSNERSKTDKSYCLCSYVE